MIVSEHRSFYFVADIDVVDWAAGDVVVARKDFLIFFRKILLI
jgi:hypothetical protein